MALVQKALKSSSTIHPQIRKKTSVLQKRMMLTLFILPAFFIHALVVSIPSISTVYYSMTDWSGLGNPVFSGFNNFKKLLKDTMFHHALMHNVIWMLMGLTLPIIMGLLIGLTVKKVGKSQMIYRTIYFMPFVVTPVVAGKIWAIYYNPYDGINKFLNQLGIMINFNWIGDVKLALYSIFLVDFWHWWGFVMVLLLAALHQVDSALYEAAAIEGANRLRQFWHITLTQIRPTLITVAMLTIIGSFLSFDYVWVMTQGGPAGSTELASTWIFKQAITNYEAGYGSAMSLIVSLICMLVYAGFRNLQKRGWDV
jgi:raffinose/stachyose/melibiose transport system permease protein